MANYHHKELVRFQRLFVTIFKMILERLETYRKSVLYRKSSVEHYTLNIRLKVCFIIMPWSILFAKDVFSIQVEDQAPIAVKVSIIILISLSRLVKSQFLSFPLTNG